MQINFTGRYNRCIKNFTPLPIVSKMKEQPEGLFNRYFIFGNNGNIIGRFDFKNDGYISNFSLLEDVKHKKIGIDAILSIKNFVTKKAKENNFDFVKLEIAPEKSNHILKLCEKLGIKKSDMINNGNYELVRVLNSDTPVNKIV